jgi:hypothetical protein
MIDEREVFWIKTLVPEYNRSEGGRGCRGHVVSEEARMKLSEKGKLQWQAKSHNEKYIQIKNNLTNRRKKGYVMRDESKQKMSTDRKGKTNIPPETYLVISEKNKLKLLGNQNGNKQVAYYKDGILCGTFPSTKLAGESMGVHPSCITGVLKGKRKTTCGYTWKYFNN